MKTDSILVQYQATRAIPTWEKGATIEVDAKAYSLNGQSPYFSVTAMIYTPASRRRHDCDACGCLHEEILRMWPKLAPIVALHSSDAITGEPMHGEANGFYWLAGALGGLGERYHGDKTPDECLRIFADHCRITVYEAEAIGRAVKFAYDSNHVTGNKVAKAQWKEIYKDMLPRFKREAEAGIALLQKLSGQPVTA